MKLSVLNVSIFGGLAIWAASSHPWATPGFAALAASRVILLAVALRPPSPRRVGPTLLLQLSLGYVGITYLVSFSAGSPRTAGFWAVFGHPS